VKRDIASYALRNSHSPRNELGFALLEVIIAIVIMALVGLMAWRGMDAMIRGREVIDRRASQDADHAQLVRQFERDCQEVLQRHELNSLALVMSNKDTQGTNVSAIAGGAKNIWFIRHYRVDNQYSWLIVGYGMGPNGLQRWVSPPLLRRMDAASLWAGILKDPDLNSNDLSVSLEVPVVVRQTFLIQTSVLSGAGGSGVSSSGTGTSNPGTSITNDPNAAGASSASGTSALPNGSIALLPEPLGVTMQWWIKDINLPITRSCLTGYAL
jgi:Tfp pilus assembly protein PilE